MCGSLKLEGQKNFTPNGSKIPCRYIAGAKEDKYWDGFARTDGARNRSKSLPEQWPPDKWKVAAIHTSQFTEHRRYDGSTHTFSSSRIGCLINEESGQLKILTRPAKTQRELTVHHRMPSQIPKSWTLKEYTAALNKYCNGNYSCKSESMST
jgi:hypothetical protein